MPLICTYGYEGRDIDEFLNLIDRYEVDLVVDVRRKPMSKDYPAFDKFSLVGTLQEHGKHYLHVKELGCPLEIQDLKCEELGMLKYFQGYERHLQKHREIIKNLAAATRDLNLCILCAEPDPEFCHRTLVADYLQIENFDSPIQHWQKV